MNGLTVFFRRATELSLKLFTTGQKENKKLNRQAQKNDEEVYTKSIFPEVFKQVAQDGYIEQMKAFSKLFEDKRFYDTVMATLAQETYRHSNDCAL